MSAKLLIFALVAVALGCAGFVLRGDYASGNVYAEYSSQRTDRMGTAALYEALARMYPAVSRNEMPLAAFEGKGADVLILGLSPYLLDTSNLDELQALAERGNRVVVALDGGTFALPSLMKEQPLAKKWKLKLLDPRGEKLKPTSRFLFERAPDSGWRLAGADVTRAFGKGSIVLMGSSWAFTNEALRDDRNQNELSLALGDSTRFVFDETHLGTQEQGTIMGLARRFRLLGVLAVALICALLFIWQSSAPFPPERETADDTDLRLAAASAGEGLRNLLAHHIEPDKVVSACVAEWRRDRGRLVAPDTLARMEAIASGKATAAEKWLEIRELLHKSK